jgi:hypothetical protein
MTIFILRIAPVAPSMQKQSPYERRSPRIKTPDAASRTTSDGAAPLQGWGASSPSSPEQQSSKTIPLPSSHVHRTQSELQLYEDMELAERKDMNMFYRLVNGIRDRQMHIAHGGMGSPYPNTMSILETNSCIANIINTRNTPLDAAPIQTLERVRTVDDAMMGPRNDYNGGHGVPGCVDDWSIAGFEQYPVRQPSMRRQQPQQYGYAPYFQGAPFDPQELHRTMSTTTEEEEEIFSLEM